MQPKQTSQKLLLLCGDQNPELPPPPQDHCLSVQALCVSPPLVNGWNLMWKSSFPWLCYFIWQKRFLQRSWMSIINLCLPSIRKNARYLPVNHILSYQPVQSLSCVWLFATPLTVAHQASLSTISQSFLKLMSIESVMPSNHLILCHPFLLLPSIFLSIRVFSNGSARLISPH